MKESQLKNKTNEGFAIYHDLKISASMTKVFEAITSPDHLVNWWPLKCIGSPEIGGEYNFYFTSEYDWYGEVIEHSLNKAFHIKMTQSDADWESTTFGFDIEEGNGKVQLRFRHVGWQECNAHFRKSSFSWAILLNGLRNYIEKGVIIPFDERE